MQGARASFTRRLAQLEEQGEEPQPVVFPDKGPALERAGKSFVRGLAVRVCRRGLQVFVLATQDPRTAKQLLKRASPLLFTVRSRC